MPSHASTGRRAAVADALHSAAIHLLRAVRATDVDTGIGPARLSALSVLVFGGPRRLTELAAAEQVRPPTMTKIVTGLEAAGLVRRSGDRDDARAVRIEATARGRRLLVQGRQRRVDRLTASMTTLQPHELDVLAHAAALLERVAGRMTAEAAGPAASLPRHAQDHGPDRCGDERATHGSELRGVERR